MAHKCFVSFKTEDLWYKNYIRDEMSVDIIDKSLHSPIESSDDDYIMRKIREDYLSDSTVTIALIGTRSAEILGAHEQRFIKREVQASLYNGVNNTKNGILGIVLPSMYDQVYKGSIACRDCGGNHNYVCIGDSTVIKEFSYNYYIPQEGKCAWAEEDRYCVLIRWDMFCTMPSVWVDAAFDKRTDPIASETKVKP